MIGGHFPAGFCVRTNSITRRSAPPSVATEYCRCTIRFPPSSNLVTVRDGRVLSPSRVAA